MKTLKDIIDYNLKALFIGINPSLIAVAKGHYHQGKLGKRFWKRLKDYGILNYSREGFEDSYLLENRFGITDIVKRPTRRADLISKIEFSEGAEILREKIIKYKPGMLCFIYKKAATEAAKKLLGEEIRGFGDIGNKFYGIHTFIMPSMYASKEQEKDTMKELAQFISK